MFEVRTRRYLTGKVSRERAALELMAQCCAFCRSGTEDLAGEFLQAAISVLGVQRAALYRRSADGGGLVAERAAGFPDGAPRDLAVEAPPEFLAVSGRPPRGLTAEDEMALRLRHAAGLPHVLWAWDPQSGLALLAASSEVPDGDVVDFSEDDREMLVGVLHAFAQIARSDQLERQLRDTEHRHRLLTEHIQDVIWELDLDMNYVYVSPSVTRARGFEPEELIGRPVGERMTQGSLLVAREVLAEELAAERSGNVDPERSRTIELELLTRDGGTLWCEVTLRFVRDDEGRPTGLAGVSRDITDRRRAEAALRESERRLTMAMDAANQGLWEINLATGEAYFSPQCYRMLGYEPGELPASVATWLGLLHPEDLGAMEVYLAEEPDPRDTHELQFRLRDKSGGYKWVLVRGEVLSRSAEGHTEAVLGTIVDISDLKQAEASLRESKETAWAMLNATNEMALLLDTQFRITGANEAFAQRFGCSAQELVGRVVFDLLPGDTARARREHMDRVMRTGIPERFEDASEGRHFLTSVHPIRDARGRVGKVAVFAHDITDRKRVEDAQRLAALGQLSAGVAHEFNNILAGIMLIIERAKSLDSREEYGQLAERARMLAMRGAKIAGNLTAFARPGTGGRRAVVMDTIIDSALAVTSSELLQSGVVVERERCVGDARAIGNPAELDQVLVNLIINSCQAMPDGGTLNISTRRTAPAAGGEVIVTISDTGEGIEPEDLPRVFEPFFTTKGPLGGGELVGSGLGLSVSHGIITSHGGTIEASSDPGLGTTFEIRLPALEAASLVGESDGAGAAEGPRRSVLLAEDERDIGGMITEVLQRQGHDVVHVSSGDQAVAQLRERHFDLVITDLLMPGGGGQRVLAAAGKRACPPLTMVITGHIGDALAAELERQGVNRCLRKPFGVTDLLRAVEDLLAAPRAPNS